MTFAVDLTTKKIPDGSYDLTPEAHETLLLSAHAGGLFGSSEGSVAHPVFAHLATHVGKGADPEAFLDLIGADRNDGLVFGRGSFEFAEPLRVGVTYEVRAAIVDVQRKLGGKIGVFDAITVASSLGREGRMCVRTTETFIVPRPRVPIPAPSSRGTGGRGSIQGSDAHPSWVASHGADIGPIRQDDVLAVMQLMGDVNPVHVDAELARAKGYRGPVNQGPVNLAFVFNEVVRQRGGLSGLRRAEFSFHETVTVGDSLRVEWRDRFPLPDPEEDQLDARLVLPDGTVVVTCGLEFSEVATTELLPSAVTHA